MNPGVSTPLGGLERDTPMNRALPLMLSLGTVLSASTALARPDRVNQIPNGSLRRCATCHSSSFPERNPFGAQIEAQFLAASGRVIWGPELAALDADGDGVSNGAELLDPRGSWQPGQSDPGDAAQVTAPGKADEFAPTPAPALGGLVPGLLGLGLCGLFGLGTSRREV